MTQTAFIPSNIIDATLKLLDDTNRIPTNELDEKKLTDVGIIASSPQELQLLLDGLRSMAEGQTTGTLDAADKFALLREDSQISPEDRKKIRVDLGFPAEDPADVEMKFFQLPSLEGGKQIGVLSVVHYIPLNRIYANPIVAIGGIHHPSNLYHRSNLFYAQSGRHVYAIDSAGVGCSAFNKGVFTSYNRIVNGFRTVAEYVIKKHDQNISAIGHSLGSVALGEIADHPEDPLYDRIDALVGEAQLPDEWARQAGSTIASAFMRASLLNIFGNGLTTVDAVKEDVFAKNHGTGEQEGLGEVWKRERFPIHPINFVGILLGIDQALLTNKIGEDSKVLAVYGQDDHAVPVPGTVGPNTKGVLYLTQCSNADGTTFTADHDFMVGAMGACFAPQILAAIEKVEQGKTVGPADGEPFNPHKIPAHVETDVAAIAGYDSQWGGTAGAEAKIQYRTYWLAPVLGARVFGAYSNDNGFTLPVEAYAGLDLIHYPFTLTPQVRATLPITTDGVGKPLVQAGVGVEFNAWDIAAVYAEAALNQLATPSREDVSFGGGLRLHF